MRGSRAVTLAASLVAVVPLVAAEPLEVYRIGFSVVASGTFAMVDGIPGDSEDSPPIIALGEGVLRIAGAAALLQEGRGWYFDAASIRVVGHLVGNMTLLDSAGNSLSNPSYQMRMRGLPSADGRFFPDGDLFLLAVRESFPPAIASFEYEETLVDPDVRSVVRTQGSGPFLIAGPVEMGGAIFDAVVMFLEDGGQIRTLVFSTQPELGSLVDVQVTLRRGPG